MLKQNALAATGMTVSPIGLGTVKFGRNEQVNYPEKFALPDDQQILELLSVATELGINLLDTAPAYGNSEERLGTLLKNQRAKWILSTKVGEDFIAGKSSFDFTPQAVQQSVERSLKRLQTDYLDIVLIHSNGEDVKIIEENAIFATLAELKQAGKIRSYGMSTKTVAGGLLALQHSDIVMVTHNPTYADEQSVIAYAHANNKGVFIKKALASGHLQKIAGAEPVLEALQFIFREPGVSSVILGTLNPAHLRYNVACASTVIPAQAGIS